jgi:hypothetical protein
MSLDHRTSSSNNYRVMFLCSGNKFLQKRLAILHCLIPHIQNKNIIRIIVVSIISFGGLYHNYLEGRFTRMSQLTVNNFWKFNFFALLLLLALQTLWTYKNDVQKKQRRSRQQKLQIDKFIHDNRLTKMRYYTWD